MISADDIKDIVTLEAWLEARPEASARRDAICIAHRAAMRVMPVYVSSLDSDWARKIDLTALPILRSSLTAGFGCTSGTSVGTDASYAAAAAAESVETEALAEAAYAAAYAALTADYGNAEPVSYAAESASNGVGAAAEAAAEIWDSVRLDALRIEGAADPLMLPLWSDRAPQEIEMAWTDAQDWLAAHPGHAFWIRWYQAALHGRPLTGDWGSHWQMLEEIALIPNSEWPDREWVEAKKPDRAPHVARLIAKIEETYSYPVPEITRVTAEKLLRSALARFGFNDVRRFMEMLPFASDLKMLKEPQALAAFLEEADEVTWKIEWFLNGLQREERKLQGSGGVLSYFDAALSEISKGRQESKINIGRVVFCGERLQHFATDRETVEELGPYADGLKASVEGLQGLVMRHFSATILRMATLKDIRSSDEVNLSELLQDLQRGFKAIQSDLSDDMVPMAPEALAVFNTLFEDLDNLVFKEAMTIEPAFKTRLRKEADYRMAQIAVSLRLFVEQSRNAREPVTEVMKGVAINKTAQTVEGLVKWFLEALGGK